MNLEQKLDLLLKLMNDIQAENAMLACFVQASIASHHSPKALLDVFNMASNQLTSAHSWQTPRLQRKRLPGWRNPETS